jgi:ParB-like chromosome segregation protein Spo0J
VLANVQGPLPPITVRRSTMQVIDGRHRIRAAIMNGRSEIDARLVDCDEGMAFALAVSENIAHGLPLSLADRRAAALSIIAYHPRWSDRVVAVQAGLSDKTISALRTAGAPVNDGSQEAEARLGMDGRLRPLNTAAMRRKAAQMLTERPEAALREVARSTGLSPATVRDVRMRLDTGKDPVPARYSGGQSRGSAEVIRARRRNGEQAALINLRDLLAKLRSDPSLKFSEAGRNVVRWLDRHAVDPESSAAVATRVPDRWAITVAHLARSSAMTWTMLAEQLEQRPSDDGTARPGA